MTGAQGNAHLVVGHLAQVSQDTGVGGHAPEGLVARGQAPLCAFSVPKQRVQHVSRGATLPRKAKAAGWQGSYGAQVARAGNLAGAGHGSAQHGQVRVRRRRYQARGGLPRGPGAVTKQRSGSMACTSR